MKETTFKVGDPVIDIITGKVGTVTNINGDGEYDPVPIRVEQSNGLGIYYTIEGKRLTHNEYPSLYPYDPTLDYSKVIFPKKNSDDIPPSLDREEGPRDFQFIGISECGCIGSFMEYDDIDYEDQDNEIAVNTHKEGNYFHINKNMDSLIEKIKELIKNEPKQ